jgi:VWFA-related protein
MASADCRGRLVAPAVLGAAALAAAAQQEQPRQPVFPTGVEFVTVDVVVTDERGAPVTGLGQDAFVVEEDGRPQRVETFEAVDVRADPAGLEAAPPAPLRVSTNQAPTGQPERTYVLVFDDVNLTPFSAEPAKRALSEFVDSGLQQRDRVLLLASGGGTWWSARLPEGKAALLGVLARLQGRALPYTRPDRVTPWEAMRIHLYRDLQVGARVARRLSTYGAMATAHTGVEALGEEYRFNFEHPYVLARAREVYVESTARNRATLDAIERALRALSPGRGRKALLLLSEGFFHDPNQGEFKRVLEASRRTNAALYFIDARGLPGMPLATTAEFGPALHMRDLDDTFTEAAEASEGSERLADESGGFSVKNANDLGRGLARVAAETTAYYLLGYRSTNPARDGRFRRIKVEVRRSGVNVRARAGYYAPSAAQDERDASTAGAGRDAPLEVALNSPFDPEAIPLRACGFVFDASSSGKARVLLVVEADLRSVELGRAGGRLAGELDTLIVVSRADGAEPLGFDQKVELNLKPDALDRLGQDWYTLTRDVELEPGRYQARVVVRDRSSGRVGALTHGFDVPAPGALRISTPIVSDALGQTPSGGVHPVMGLRRGFRSANTLYCEYQVYGAQREPTGGLPRVSGGFEVRPLGGGSPLVRVESTPLKPTPSGLLSRIVIVPLEGAPPGAYELVLNVRDELSGKELESREPFVIEASS